MVVTLSVERATCNHQKLPCKIPARTKDSCSTRPENTDGKRTDRIVSQGRAPPSVRSGQPPLNRRHRWIDNVLSTEKILTILPSRLYNTMRTQVSLLLQKI